MDKKQRESRNRQGIPETKAEREPKIAKGQRKAETETEAQRDRDSQREPQREREAERVQGPQESTERGRRVVKGKTGGWKRGGVRDRQRD